MNYWLMKSEPKAYSIDDLEREKITMWEGCRNYQVRNILRDTMKIGDQAFFYHSNATPSGIVGTMRIISEPYPDPTQFDLNSKYYDPKSSPIKPTWCVRDVEFLEKWQHMITIAELKNSSGFQNLAAIQKGQRLSITFVTPQEWQQILSLKSRLRR